MATFIEELVEVKTVKFRSLTTGQGTKNTSYDNNFYTVPAGRYAIVRVLGLSSAGGDISILAFGPGSTASGSTKTQDKHTEIDQSTHNYRAETPTSKGQTEVYLDEGEQVWRTTAVSMTRTSPVIWLMIFEFNKP